ncbi:hypothetical protein NDU88_001008 [Pleurodeles waltl]|uniref:Uncharacterized protein n=1 Tax=Pleurodeles waltl TaxID=8319 RepID=A0AAV7VV63_PLEWA|nr:hypothetical protein NDU88_001008 [Pleurodeles waltl]
MCWRSLLGQVQTLVFGVVQGDSGICVLCVPDGPLPTLEPVAQHNLGKAPLMAQRQYVVLCSGLDSRTSPPLPARVLHCTPMQQRGISISSLPSREPLPSARPTARPTVGAQPRRGPPLLPGPHRAYSPMLGPNPPRSRAGTSLAPSWAALPLLIHKQRHRLPTAGGSSLPQLRLVAPSRGLALPGPASKFTSRGRQRIALGRVITLFGPGEHRAPQIWRQNHAGPDILANIYRAASGALTKRLLRSPSCPHPPSQVGTLH